jgi:hypothetical protein
MNVCHLAGDATHLFTEHGVDNANYPIEHDIFSPSTVELLIAPEYRCNWALPYGLVQRLMTALKSSMTTYLDPLAQ